MNRLGQSYYKRACLAARQTRLQPVTAVEHRYLPWQLPLRIAPKPNLVQWWAALLLVLLLHVLIWWLATSLPTAKLPVRPDQPVNIEIIAAVEPPKIPPVVEKPLQIPAKVPQPMAPTAQSNPPIQKKPQAVQPSQAAKQPVASVAVEAAATNPAAAPVVSLPAEAVKSAATADHKTTLAKGYAGYLGNPQAVYPDLAMERGWEGSVVLRVKVAANGKPDSISIKNSSGRKVLDLAAQRAVQGWRFAPATRGEVAVEGWVDVPIHFRLP